MLKIILKNYIGLLLLTGALIIGLRTYKTYGISWDEDGQRGLGLVTYNYLFHGDDSLRHFDNNVYGVGFELPLVIIEKALDLKDSRDIFLMRHLLTHLFFLLGAFAFFLLIDYLYHNKLLATIGFLLIVVNPLIYGHSFFNTKDTPFCSMFMICFLITAVAFKKNNYRWYILLGAACAVLTNMRIMGVLLIGCIWIFFAIDYIAAKEDKATRKKTLRYLLVFTLTSILVLYITWPFLYNNPVQNFVNAFKRMSKYPWEGEVLFWGHIYKSTKIPAYYGLSWFSISNPLPYLTLGLFGIIFLTIQFFKEPRKYIYDKLSRNHILFMFCFVEPLLAILAFHSVLYDAWRQLYFIYPPFILIALFGLDYLLKTKAKIPVLLILFAGIGYTGYYMISNFPHEHVYLNEIARSEEPEYLRKNFELDYWGTAYKQAFEYILKTDTAKHILIEANGSVGPENAQILTVEERKRIEFTLDISKANYFVSLYRTHPEDYNFPNHIYSIKVMNSTIMCLFKIR